MAESVDALVSNTSGATRAGSTPALGTETEKVFQLSPFFSYHQAMWTKKIRDTEKNLYPLIYFTLTSHLLENYSLLFHSGSLADKYCETYTFYLAYQEP